MSESRRAQSPTGGSAFGDLEIGLSDRASFLRQNGTVGVGDRQGVQIVGKETLVYREGENWYEIYCAWGGEPGWALIPSVDSWNIEVPAWLTDRRETVVSAIEEFGLHIQVRETKVLPYEFGVGEYRSQWPKNPTVTVLGPFPVPHRKGDGN